jgi:hypothetical protein
MPTVIIQMCLRGSSNRSLKNIFRTRQEDYDEHYTAQDSSPFRTGKICGEA